tara:strand:+ start:1194 stop:2849 length:1656 start_codon:yes stop_codon:yes gene_type:complete
MAINFPNSPVNGNTYKYNEVTYIYSKNGIDEGYWKVALPHVSGVATTEEVDEGTNMIKYISPASLQASKYSQGNEILVTSDRGDTARDLSARFNDILNVKDFGAVGDGITDDSDAFEAATALGGTVYVPDGTYYLTRTITVNTVGCNVVGAGINNTIITTDQNILLFSVRFRGNFSQMSITNTNVSFVGIAIGTPAGDSGANQAVYCRHDNLFINGFYHGFWYRTSIWCSWKDINTRNLCGIRLSRHGDPYDRTNPSAPASWNIFAPILGWFHNIGNVDGCNFEDTDVGFWGSPMSFTFNACTTQKQQVSASAIMPVGNAGTGLYLESGTEGSSTGMYNNVIINHYSESTKVPVKLIDCQRVNILGQFVQGGPNSAKYLHPLEAIRSNVWLEGCGGSDWFNNKMKLTASQVYGEIGGTVSGNVYSVDATSRWKLNGEAETGKTKFGVSFPSGGATSVTLPTSLTNRNHYVVKVGGIRDGFDTKSSSFDIYYYQSGYHHVVARGATPYSLIEVTVVGGTIVVTWNHTTAFNAVVYVEEVSEVVHQIETLTPS